MNKKRTLFLACFLTIISANAQFTDTMESYTDGEPINEGHWTDGGCGGGEGCSLLSSSAFAAEGDLSGFIPGDETTEAVLDLGNKIFGGWGLVFWVYIPEGREASMSFQGTVPIEEGNSTVGDVLFNKDLENPGMGIITDAALGEVLFEFPHNDWFKVVMYWDISTGISLATWQFNVDGEDVLPYGTPYTNQSGEYPTALGGILFSSVSPDNAMYLDYFCYSDWGGGSCNLNIDENKITNFKIFPNPSNNLINIQSNRSIKTVKIYDVIGNQVLVTSETYHINISSLSKGLYFIAVETENARSIQKFIKK